MKVLEIILVVIAHVSTSVLSRKPRISFLANKIDSVSRLTKRTGNNCTQCVQSVCELLVLLPNFNIDLKGNY